MKWLKIIASTLGILVLIAIIAIAALIMFVNPNRFKPLLIDQVHKSTGRELAIDGDLTWTLYPALGVKVGHLQLSNPADFKEKTFAEIDSATISVKILPLLHGQVESNGIIIKGLKLNLIKNANGKTNWADLQKTSKEESASKTEQTQVSPSKGALGLAISGIDISNAKISWINEQAKQNFDITKFELHLKNITLTKPIPFQTSFKFDGKNPDMNGTVSMTSDISLNPETQLYALHKLDLTLKMDQNSKKIDLNLKGDASLDMAHKKLQLDNVKAQTANLVLTGKANVTNVTDKPKTTGHLQIQPFDLRQLLATIGQNVESLETAKNVSGDFDFTAGTTLASVDLKGLIKIDEVKASKVRMTAINAKMQLDNGILNLTPVTAAFYQGTLDGSAKVNLNTAAPQITLNAKLTNMQAEPLMADLAPNSKVKISGAGNVEVQVTTSGSSGDVITKNLNGTTKLSFVNGTLHGIDIGYLLDSAFAIARKQPQPTTDTKQTPFGSLTGTSVIKNGVVHNNDLKIDSPRFNTTGEGVINLVTQQIDYHLATSVKKTSADQKNELANLYGLAIPMYIKGALSDPSIRLDTNVLMKAIASQQLQKAKENIKDKLQEQIKDKIPGKAGEFLNNLLSQ